MNINSCCSPSLCETYLSCPSQGSSHVTEVNGKPEIILRRFRPCDSSALGNLYGNDAAMKYLGGPKTPNQVQRDLQCYTDHHRRYGWGPMVIEDLSTQRLVGRTGCRISDAPDIITLYHPNGDLSCFRLNEKVQIGYVVDPDYQRMGIASRAASAVIDFGFRGLNFDEIAAFIRPENYASIKVARKIRMRLIGSFLYGGGLWEYHSISQKQWANN